MGDFNGGRIKFVDVLRVVAIFLVIGFHLAYNINPDSNYRKIGFVGVSLFFILSGFILARKYPKHQNFSFGWFFKRYVSIASFYYLALISVTILLWRQVFSGNLLGNLFAHFLFIDFYFPQYAYGFISSACFLTPLICLYLLYPYINRYVVKSNGFLFLAFFLMIILRLFYGTLTSFSPLFFIGEFCFGIAFAHGKKKEALLFSFLVVFVDPVMFIPFLVFYIASLFGWKYVPQKMLDVLGVNAFVLFLFHEIIIKVVMGKWHVYGLDKMHALTLVIFVILVSVYLSEKVKAYILSIELLHCNKK